MAQWVRGWNYLTHSHDGRKDGGSNPDRGSIVEGVFHPNQATGKVFSTKMPSIDNS